MTIRLDYEPTDEPIERPTLARRIINRVKIRPVMLDCGYPRPSSPRDLRALADLRDMLDELEEADDVG